MTKFIAIARRRLYLLHDRIYAVSSQELNQKVWALYRIGRRKQDSRKS
jgi:hypothetical protein